MIHLPDKQTWIEPEERCYPSGGFLRRGRVRVVRNRHTPVSLPYGEIRAVRLSLADTISTIPARLRYQGRTIRGFVSYNVDTQEHTFTPEASEGEHHANDDCHVS